MRSPRRAPDSDTLALMAHLRPCAGCARHVRADATECPFCTSSLEVDLAPPPVPRERIGRAARMAFGTAAAAVALGVTGCEKENIAMPYGAPPDPKPLVPDAAKPPPPADAGATAVPHPPDAAIAKPYGAPPASGFVEV